MKINSVTSLEDFEAWSGATETKDRIIEEGKAEEFESIINELYPDGINETGLNDLLWFESELIYETLGITDEEEDDEDEEGIEEDLI